MVLDGHLGRGDGHVVNVVCGQPPRVLLFAIHRIKSNTENAAVGCAAPKPEFQAFLSFCVLEIVSASSLGVRNADSELTLFL